MNYGSLGPKEPIKIAKAEERLWDVLREYMIIVLVGNDGNVGGPNLVYASMEKKNS